MDKFDMCLIKNTHAPVKQLSNINFTGMEGNANRPQDITMTLVKDTNAEVSHIKDITFVARKSTKKSLISEDINSCGDVKSKQGSELSFTRNKLNEKYQFLEEIGSGAFGQVFKVKDKCDDKVYAIKQIEFQDLDKEKVLREVRTLSDISSDRVVRYYDSWIQSNCLFIKMEFCSHNLKHIIQQKRELFGRESSQVMEVIEYHISCQLFKELLECVQFLHEMSPPIIHRDLKPHNVLISVKPINGKYFKLCDFGLAIVHDMESMSLTSGVGTPKYMAPEICRDRKYNIKADIYSLGRIGEDLFDLDTNRPSDNVLMDKFQNLWELILMMTKVPFYNLRPNCAQILEILSNDITFDKKEIEFWPQFEAMRKVLTNVENKVFLAYLDK